MQNQLVIDRTRLWVAEFVIGLNLCPFAQRVFDAGKVRWLVSAAHDEPQLRADLASELKALADAPAGEIETTLLIHPHVLADFLDYNDFLDVADRLLEELGLDGVIQVASFHPQYRFADTEADAVENFSNRSPYPMLHLLREDSVSAVADDEEMLADIPKRNIETLRALGIATIVAMLKKIEGR